MDKKIFEKILIKELGISLDEKRIEFVKNRLSALGWKAIDLSLSRFATIVSNKKDSNYNLLVDLLTVHETYFFREYNQLEVFANTILNPYATKKYDIEVSLPPDLLYSHEYLIVVSFKRPLDDDPPESVSEPGFFRWLKNFDRKQWTQSKFNYRVLGDSAWTT